MVVVLLVRDMLARTRITELLRKSEINDVDKVSILADAHNEVGGLDVAMDEIARMDVFDARYLQDKKREVSGHCMGT